MTKRHLYLFNPEHDLALASGETNYIPPASARKMAEDLALLPVWYAAKNSVVLASSAYNSEFLKSVKKLFGDCACLLTPPEIAVANDWDVTPWGWNPAMRKRFLSLGMDERQLPSMQYLSELRKFSHRSQAVTLLPKLQLNEYFCGESFYLQTQDECECFVEARETCLLKAPLSGSGKGLNWCRGVFTTFISGWCSRVTLSQGGVVGEPIYNKVKDFAMEFHSDGAGRVVFVGYSLFNTGGSGVYTGSVLLSDEKILNQLSAYVPRKELLRLQVCLEDKLSALFGSFYNGYLGVDMMMCAFSNEMPVYRIHPCVEINLRMNMGVVARLLTDRYLVPASEGVFQLAYFPVEGMALKDHLLKSASFPLFMEGGRVRSGYLPLVPVTVRSQYSAWIEVRSDGVSEMPAKAVEKWV